MLRHAEMLDAHSEGYGTANQTKQITSQINTILGLVCINYSSDRFPRKEA